MAVPAQDLQRRFIPAPTGGWNVRDPLWAMPETDARTLDNIFPEATYCRLKGGVTEIIDIGTAAVATLAVFTTSAGTEKVIAICDNGILEISNITGSASSASIKGGVTVTNDYWQHFQYNGRIFLFNGVNPPLDWTGTGNVNATGWTGPASISLLVQGTAYKGRPYMVEYGTTSYWYHQTIGAVTGALTQVNVASFLTKGGSIKAVGSTSNSIGNTNQELFVIYSDQGEVLVYQGDYPDSVTWSIVGQYYIAKPGSYRCMSYIGSELHLYSLEGPIPLSLLLSNRGEVLTDYIVPAGKVRNAFTGVSRTYSGLELWEGIYCPNNSYAIFNVPISGTVTYQYVMNTLTKAWARFTGWNATAWMIYAGQPYYGAISGGKIYKADVQYALDSASSKLWTVKFPYTGMESPDTDKLLTFVKPLFAAANNTVTADTTTYTVSVSADFDTVQASTFSKTMNRGAQVLTLNKALENVSYQGQFIGLGLSGNHTAETNLELYGINIYTKNMGI